MDKIDFNFKAVAAVKNERKNIEDDNWENIVSEIILLDDISRGVLKNIEKFSHLEIIDFFHQVDEENFINSGYPRGDPEYPEMGIFAQRKKERINRIGLCIVELLKAQDRTLKVKYLDAIDGTPVIDIKPVFREFLPIGKVGQPSWVSDLMKQYW